MQKLILGLLGVLFLVGEAQARPMQYSRLIPLAAGPSSSQIELKNDNYVDTGSPAYIQQGFVSGEKAGVWVKVPASVKQFKVDSFRVLIGNGTNSWEAVFFQMGIAKDYSPSIPADIDNAAQVTAGPYWNDIPATGSNGSLRCAKAGELVGAAIEFTHEGLPSIYRAARMSNPKANVLFAVPGGWNYSVAYGLQGDWILRVMGHEAKAGECS